MQQIWKEKGLPEGLINKEVTSAFAKRLWGGVVKGYGSDIGAVDYDTPDFKMLAALQRNVWQFSAAKNYTQLREMGAKLIGDDGKLRSFDAFKEAVGPINDKFANQHLKVEYNLAVAGGQMAGKWVDIERQRDIFPYLEFDAVLDKQTTELCRGLNGTLLPIDHPFWKKYYPPNHFNCRSTVRQKRSGQVTPEDKIPSADIPAMFEVNLGQRGLIFPKDHAYFIDSPQNVNTIGFFRKMGADYALKNYEGKIVGDIEISKSGIKEIANQNHDEKEMQLQLMHNLPQLIENSDYVTSADDSNGHVKKFHYHKVRGLEKFFLVIREKWNGEKDLYSIVDHLKTRTPKGKK